MGCSFRWAAITTGAASILTATVAAAGTLAVSAPPHLRPLTADARAIVDELVERSATARDMVEHLEQSDVVVYIRYRSFETTRLEGRVGLLGSSGSHRARFLIVELAIGRSRLQQMVTLGHELRHAIEIADAPSIVDPHTLSEHYATMGTSTSLDSRSETFETRAALEAATQVRLELTARPIRTEPHGSR